MPGGLIQLVAVGAQDSTLTDSPEITFFKSVYRPYVNFAIESIEQQFNGTVDFGRKVTVELSRNGDLVSGMLLQVTLPLVTASTGTNPYVRWAPNIGHTLIKNVAIEIGGQQIDKHYGDWLNVWNELTMPAEKLRGFNEMTGAENMVLLLPELELVLLI
jgi:hypothetical protein